MPFVPVLLATDALLWALVVAAGIYAAYCRRRPHLAAPWRRVFRSRTAVASAVVLAAFLAIALADSVHFRLRLAPVATGEGVAREAAYSPEVLSLLDLAAARLRSSAETPSPAPLAARAHVRELMEDDQGRPMRAYPRLRYGGAHLADEGGRAGDIAKRTSVGLAAGVALAIVLLAIGGPLRRRWPEVPWAAAWWTVAAGLAVAGPVVALAAGYHVLGTDKVGQDVLYLSLKSIRTSVVIGTLTTLVMLPLGIAFGIAAGYFRGWVDDAIQYLYTTLSSIPAVLLIAAAVLMMQVYIDTHPELFPTAAQRADFRLLMLCLILGVTTWTSLTRLLRGETLKLSELDYIQAAHAFGVSNARILARHILPNVAHIVIITLVLDFSALVLAEAVLSYVGVGVDPSTTSFGTMINAARLEMGREPVVWWSLASAFAFMFLLVLAANLLADAVRDGFDPRVRMGGLAVA